MEVIMKKSIKIKGNQLERLIELTGETKTNLAKFLGVNRATLHWWINYEKIPQDMFEKIKTYPKKNLNGI